MTPAKVGILVLAAGGSTRMGRPKQLLPFHGKSLVRHATETALAVGRPVVVVVGAEAETVSAEIRELPVGVVVNANWASGMGSSIRAGVHALIEIEPNLEAVLITLCDQPRISVSVLRELIESHHGTGKSLCAVRFADTVGPPALLGREFFAELLALPNAQGAKQILMRHMERLHCIPCPEAADDIDTPLDYESVAQADRR
jgi:molybdenum cofactor cytidylyltransferase